MKSDGAVIIDTQLRPDGMEKGFKEIKRGAQSVVNDVQGATEKINAAFSKVDVSKPVSNAALKVESLKQQLSSVTSEFNLAVADNDDKAAERLAAKRISLYDRLEAARKKLEIEVAAAANREATAEEKAAKEGTIFWRICHYLFAAASYILCQAALSAPNDHNIFLFFRKSS